ncbi:MAG: ATP-dependent DNA ligase [Candidatus Methanomethylicota archaeon]|jgi:DNA ligase-1|uniref:DNA ligase n=1 Tax=Thermoproteota archaeon TaxID=2056631 RepID=A0A520KFV3_9CREN|nr:MAG: ATP-dependent DNA ligase [Candidatus Verstraetearchaeota archaeon]TDA40044.1 MAG: ATP-dependent DNA ligase [Candidatus Verstraetearchaeota archaeon]
MSFKSVIILYKKFRIYNIGDKLKYSELVDFYERIGQTTKRLEITDLLVGLFSKCPSDLIDKVVYLTQGRIFPEFIPLELGMGDKMIMRSIAQAATVKESEVEQLYKTTGDLGKVANILLSKGKKQVTLDLFSSSQKKEPITVERVYRDLEKIAKAQGPGSQEEKIRILSDLLRDSSPREAMYIVRTVNGTLRLGVADMTILDALTITYVGSKDARPIVERAYNLRSDLGFVAKILATQGINALKEIKPMPGIPVRPMLAERLSDPIEILEKMNGRCAAEYKYDGERVQIHKINDKEIVLFSRRLENISHHYPDVMEFVSNSISLNSYIVEGEIIAIDPDTNEFLPFQELMHRRRKYDIDEAMKKYPASIRLFDIIYADGVDFTLTPYPKRREFLSKVVKENDRVKLAEQKIIENVEDLEMFFHEAISDGCEGLVVKSISSESIYRAGARGWLWIKYKRDYKSEMIDTVDLVVVGGFMGTGRRAGCIGSLLLAAYNDKNDTFETVCKCATGFSDEEIKNMRNILAPYIIPHKHARVESKITPDVWVLPAIVIEVIGAEITLSPVHTCGLNAIKKGTGLAIRFPRFTGKWRYDKKPEDATTTDEIIEMYKRQLKKLYEEVESIS